MQKKTQHLRGGIAAAAVVCSIAIFGCTTNHTPGDGQPSTTPPMTPAATPGTSSGTNPPMASAMDLSNRVERSVEAQAIAAAHQRERFLGYINPAGPQPNPPDASQIVPPSQYVTPIATVNASISSPPTPVITSGANGDGAATFVGAPATVPAAVTGANSASLATPTTAALNATPGQFAAGPATTATAGTTTAAANTATLTPTLSSSITPSPTRAANPPMTSSSTAAASTTTSSATTTPSGTGRLVIANGATIASGSVRAVTNGTGAITVTNMPVAIKGK